MNIESAEFYLNVLKSEECQCERPKKKKMALCYNCYSSLPKHLQRELWRKINMGFQEAYEEAVKYLQED